MSEANLTMKYFYQKPENSKPIYGRTISLDHPAYKTGTLFIKNLKGLVITQQHLTCKYAYWGELDYWLANDIFLNPKFKEYFAEHASEKPYPIFEVRSVMWALRIKPLPKEEWERYF